MPNLTQLATSFARAQSLRRSEDGDSIVLENRKHNIYPKQASQVLTLTFRDGLPRDVNETQLSVHIKIRSWQSSTAP